MATTISYSLGFDPIWYIADLVGRPLGGGYLKASSSLNYPLAKAVYEDPAGVLVWPTVPIPHVTGRGIQFNENGQQGPFYFTFDSANPADLYTLEVFDSSGNLVWTVLDYDPSAGSGGGSVITDNINITNILTNNVFWRHAGNILSIGANTFRIAPGVHSALAPTPSNANPDIYFIKNNTSATDSLTFPKFAFGSNLLTGDITPVDYLQYDCTVPGSAEAQKVIQIPITQGVSNLAGSAVTVSLWLLGTSGATTVIPQFYQFFGDGSGATVVLPTPITTAWIGTPTWTKWTVSTTIPSVNAGQTIGGCHNDGLFLQLSLPLNAACSIGLTKPTVYLGTLTKPGADYQTYDQIDAVTCSPRTGHLVPSFEAGPPLGYLYMNDQTIGSASSAAANPGDETFPLYNMIWNNTNFNATTQSWAPVTPARGISAIADFIANKPMKLLYSLGAVIANAGLPNSTKYANSSTNWLLGQPYGEDQDILTVTQIAAHSHTYNSISLGGAPVATGIGWTPGAFNSGSTGGSGSSPTSGSGAAADPHNTIQPTLRFNYFIKL